MRADDAGIVEYKISDLPCPALPRTWEMATDGNLISDCVAVVTCWLSAFKLWDQRQIITVLNRRDTL